MWGKVAFSVNLFFPPLSFIVCSFSTDIGTINILWSFGNFGYILGVSRNQALVTVIIHSHFQCGITKLLMKFVSKFFVKTTGCLLAGSIYKSWLPTQVRLRHDFSRMFLEIWFSYWSSSSYSKLSSESENGLPWLEHCLHWSDMLSLTISHKVITFSCMNRKVCFYLLICGWFNNE